MKMAWFQRIRVWGMSNLGLWRGNPCVTTLFDFPSSLVTSNLFNVLWSSWGSYCWVVVAMAGLSVLAHVPTPPVDSPLHVTWGRRNIDSTPSTAKAFSPSFIHPHVEPFSIHPHAEPLSIHPHEGAEVLLILTQMVALSPSHPQDSSLFFLM